MVRTAALIAACLVTAPVLAAADPHGEPVTGTLPLGNRPGNPADQLPAGQRLISSFGERPVFSPDGKKIAFIGKSYGDAFEYDIATGRVRNLTGHAAHNGFLRVHYLADGSFLLLGPHVPAADREATRLGTIELWWMDAAATLPPVPLHVTVFEGIAVSRAHNRVAWTEVVPSRPTSFTKVTATVLKTADVVVSGGAAHLADVKTVTAQPAPDCFYEAQDFMPGDKALTLPCYRVGKTPQTDVLTIDLTSGAVTRIPTPPQLYGEIEGLFPDGKRSLVECSGDRAAGMDLCLLEMKAVNPKYTRLTHIMDWGRWKYGNPVVSPDGCSIAVQIGSADVADAGVGQGIVLMMLPVGF